MGVFELLLIGAGTLVLAVVVLLLVVMTLTRRGADTRQDIERRERRLTEREARLDTEVREMYRRAAELTALEEERRTTLERVAELTAAQARDALVAEIEADAKRRAVLSVREIEREAQEDGEYRARRILATVIQRLASEQTTESVVCVVHLPGEDMKGRIIGREGRNIRAFEHTTGVNLIIDDTPEAVLLSCFDPVRREVGRLTLEALVADGRIHPSRIEEMHERATGEVDESCRRAGEDAVVEFGITDMHPELVLTLGRLRYRTSYGQNEIGRAHV